MALLVMFLSGFCGIAASITALVGYDASWLQALMIYLVTSIVPAALIMAGIYLHTQIIRALSTPETMPDVSTRVQATR
ncbi:hypothetical protein [Aquicoccus porphyridii]|uniref:hypothetical protein n=1 Tax=Aquicoccus porphyridii TaxID=1852029 RepID=UPI00273CFC07|nr:hypothetical protein [Aquicoccus porphyridii]